MPSKQLFIIRIGLIAGVFAFAGVALYQRMQGAIPAGFPERLPLDTLRYVLWALVAASGLSTLFLRTRIESSPPARRGLLTIVGWTFGEGVALFGVILHYGGGAVTSLALGLLAFVFALVLLPVPPGRH
jgi:FtsH-binding integral membrane protein